MTIDIIPQDIFQLIQTFLTNDDYHYFLNSSKRLFGELKRKTIFFKLNRERSYLYAMNKEFQQLLLSKVENGWNQIGIICSDKSNTLLPRDIPIDLPMCKVSGVNVKIPFHLWNNYKSIDCDFFPAGVTEIPPFLNVKDVHLRTIPSGSAASVIDLRAFSHLSSLQMNALTVEDITPLKDIPYLSLSTCKEIMDFSVLSTQRELTLFQCPGLTDVSSFRSIRKLSLFCCPNISDISPLKGIYDLTLHGCSNIKDISCLGNHHRLFLSAISSGFDVLLHLPHVSLLNCDIEDVSVLRFAKSVTLNYCIKINSVSSLKTVKKVSLINSGTSGFTDLEGVPDLYLAHKNELRLNDDFIGLLNNRRLTLINNSLSNDITSLSVFSSSIQHLYCKS